MKRIVDGVTYNTMTSTAVAEATFTDRDGVEKTGTLYQTRGGAFFVHYHWTESVWAERLGEQKERERNEFEPLSAKQAQEWMLEGDVEVISNPFEDPPEAAAEAEPGATIYIRVPSSLKQRVDRAAGEEKVSANTWAMRCIESCVQAQLRRTQMTTIGSTECLARLATEGGYIVLNDEGLWLKRADGSPLQFADDFGHKFSPPLPREFFDDYRRASLIAQDMDAPPETGLVFRLTRDGVERGRSDR